jgi:hypothetical protein
MMALMRLIAATPVVFLLAVVAVACSSPAVSPAPGASVAPSGENSPTTAAPSAPASPPGTSPETPDPAPSQAVVIPHEVPELEALLPDEVAGATLTKLSVGPVSSIGVGGARAIKEVAKEIGDGSGAFGLAYAGDPAGKFNLFALRIKGADPSALLTQFAQMTLAETAGGKVDTAKLGGRDLVHVTDPISEIGDVWFYADGDTLLGVQAGSAQQATELLALLA